MTVHATAPASAARTPDRTDASGPERGWQLDEAGAEAYERNLVPAFMDAWADDLVRAVGLRPGDRVLDVATGTGIVARHAARAVAPHGSVTAVDVNPAMLSVARRVSADASVPIDYREGTAEDLPLDDDTVDAVTCQQALQFLAEPAAALAEMARVTVPGGRLGVGTCRSLRHQPGYVALTDVLHELVGVAAADVIRSPYALGEVDELRRLVRGAGYRDVHARIVVSTFRIPSAAAFLSAETSSSPLGDVLDQLDADVRGEVVAELTERLAPHTDDDGVVFPFETAVVTATR